MTAQSGCPQTFSRVSSTPFAATDRAANCKSADKKHFHSKGLGEPRANHSRFRCTNAVIDLEALMTLLRQHEAQPGALESSRLSWLSNLRSTVPRPRSSWLVP